MASQAEQVTQKVGEIDLKDKKRRILIAVDPSDQAQKAFDWYLQNLARESDEVYIFHCPEYHLDFNIMPSTDEKSIAKLTEKMKTEQNKIETLTSHFVNALRERKITGKSLVQTGKKPGQAICQSAKDEGISTIVIGTRGLGALKKMVMGSVSDFVVKHAGCPVVVVRQDDH